MYCQRRCTDSNSCQRRSDRWMGEKQRWMSWVCGRYGSRQCCSSKQRRCRSVFHIKWDSNTILGLITTTMLIIRAATLNIRSQLLLHVVTWLQYNHQTPGCNTTTIKHLTAIRRPSNTGLQYDHQTYCNTTIKHVSVFITWTFCHYISSQKCQLLRHRRDRQNNDVISSMSRVQEWKFQCISDKKIIILKCTAWFYVISSTVREYSQIQLASYKILYHNLSSLLLSPHQWVSKPNWK